MEGIFDDGRDEARLKKTQRRELNLARLGVCLSIVVFWLLELWMNDGNIYVNKGEIIYMSTCGLWLLLTALSYYNPVVTFRILAVTIAMPVLLILVGMMTELYEGAGNLPQRGWVAITTLLALFSFSLTMLLRSRVILKRNKVNQTTK